MSWGVVATSGEAADLESELRKALKNYFDSVDFDPEMGEAFHNQAKSLAALAPQVAQDLGFEGVVAISVSGHVRLGENDVPSAVTISMHEVSAP